jgi:Tfp pilus assembly protein PilX
MRTSPIHRDRPRGSVLLLAVVLLAILAVIGVAAVSLASQDKINAYSKSRVDALAACARAAQAQVWGELARYGPGYFASENPLEAPIELADGTKVNAPAHYDADPATNPVKVKELVTTFDNGVSDGSQAVTADLTNRAVPLDQLNSGKAHRVVARCIDPNGRELEVEFSMRFALF